MAEVRFYHLQVQQQEEALPALIAKAAESGKRVVVRLADEREVERINEALWTFRPDSFIPHGSARDGQPPERQPVWLTHLNENPNGAEILIAGHGAAQPFGAEIALCCEMLDGRDEGAVQAARERWKAYKDAGHAVTYWQQNERGGWDKKA